jgi:hypothetical protein
MSRTYKWQTENHQDQVSFLEALVRLFRTLSGSLHLEGLPDFAGKMPPYPARDLLIASQ